MQGIPIYSGQSGEQPCMPSDEYLLLPAKVAQLHDAASALLARQLRLADLVALSPSPPAQQPSTGQGEFDLASSASTDPS